MKEPKARRRPDADRPLHDLIGWLYAHGKHRKALDRLDEAIEDTMPLFDGDPWVTEQRRLKWLYRIELLRDMGRFTEALAWACLEVELTPDELSEDKAAAVALKERLKKDARLTPRRGTLPPQQLEPDASTQSIWPGVAGMRELKAMLERDVVLPLLEPEIYARYRLPMPNGILLYGPPGCGKTFIARKLADVVGFSFREVKPGDLANIYVHGTQGNIHQLFAEARKQAPCVLFLDEIDAMIPRRDAGSVGHHYASEVNEFLVQLNNCGRDCILVVGATNLPARLDSAALRPGRFEKKFFVGPPDYEARLELFRLYVADRPQAELDWDRCACETEGYTCAEIEHVVNEAARLALAAGRTMVTGDILNAAGNNPAAYTEEAIREMRRLT